MKIDVEQYPKGTPKKMTVDGITKDYETYYIPIELLYYNDLNGRVATDVQEYASIHGETVKQLLEKDRDAYNKVFANAIKKPSSYKTTKEDIRRNKQKVQGVILDDGRIIDGNRRYTCLCDLYEETKNPVYNKFECAVLATPSENDSQRWKIIKELELSLQYEDDKKDYDPIDTLVDFYYTCLDPEGTNLDEKEYARCTNKKDYKAQKKRAEIMIDYLEWRGQPKAWSILKNEKLYGQIVEISNSFKVDDQRFKEIKDNIYACMTLIQGDRSREIRPLAESAKKRTALYDVFASEIQNGDTEKKIGRAIAAKDKPAKTQEETTANKELVEDAIKEINLAYSAAEYQNAQERVKSGPIKTMEQIITIVNKIDVPSLKTLDDIQKAALKKYVTEVEKALEKIKNGAD